VILHITHKPWHSELKCMNLEQCPWAQTLWPPHRCMQVALPLSRVLSQVWATMRFRSSSASGNDRRSLNALLSCASDEGRVYMVYQTNHIPFAQSCELSLVTHHTCVPLLCASCQWQCFVCSVKRSKSGTEPYPGGAFASAPPEGRNLGGGNA
jgi:hypothetical protein